LIGALIGAETSRIAKLEDAGRAVGRRLIIVKASTDAEIDVAFEAFVQQRVMRPAAVRANVRPTQAPMGWWAGEPALAAGTTSPPSSATEPQQSGGFERLSDHHCPRLSKPRIAR
jgi:hypothetical protein